MSIVPPNSPIAGRKFVPEDDVRVCPGAPERKRPKRMSMREQPQQPYIPEWAYFVFTSDQINLVSSYYLTTYEWGMFYDWVSPSSVSYNERGFDYAYQTFVNDYIPFRD